MRCLHYFQKFRLRQVLILGLLDLGVSAAQGAPATIVVKSATEKELNQLPLPQSTSIAAKLLTLDEAIILALRNNPSIHSSRLQRISDKYALELADYAFQPQFQLSGSTTFTEGEKTGYNVNPAISLNTRYGTQLSLDSTTDLQGNQQETFRVMQPLLRGFGHISEIPWLDAQDSELISRQSFKSSIMDMVTQVITNYRQVVQDYNGLTVQEKALQREEETSSQYQLRVNAGKMASSELLQEQATLANTRLSVVRQRNLAEQDYQTLLDTLGLSPTSKLKLNTHIDFHAYNTPSKEEAIAIALNHNPQYVSQRLQLNSARRAVALAKDNLRWELNVSGATSFNQSKGASSIFNSTDTISTTDKPTAIVELSIPIRDITNKTALMNARVSLAQAEDTLEQSRRSLIRQVVNSLSNLTSELEQLHLAEKALDLQRKNLEAERIKQQYGQTTALNVNIILDNLLQQELDFINSQIGYLNSVTEFENLLGTTLDDWHIEMRY
jgi:outer membrane protein